MNTTQPSLHSSLHPSFGFPKLSLDRLRSTDGLDAAPVSFPGWRTLRDTILSCRVDWAISRRQPVMLGSADRPYEMISQRDQLLDRIAGASDLQVTVRCRQVGALLTDLPRLVGLDRHHALSVDFMCAVPDPRRHDALELLDAARTAADHGLSVRIVLLATVDSQRLGDFFAAAVGANVSDVVLDPDRLDPDRLEDGVSASSPAATVERLRLAYGLPRAQPGRG